jgi:hypothetical protein
MLHFTHERLFWECAESHFTNDSFLNGNYVVDAAQRHQFCGRPCFSWQSDRTLGSIFPYHQWNGVVEHYCERQLTNTTDKFPAIASIAKKVQQVVSDDYIARFFKSQLPGALLWITQTGARRNADTDMYRAPTWSWACIDGPVK